MAVDTWIMLLGPVNVRTATAYPYNRYRLPIWAEQSWAKTAQHICMAKRDNDPSEFERVAHAGSMVTLRYLLIVRAVQPPRRPAGWLWVATAAGAVTGAMTKLGWF